MGLANNLAKFEWENEIPFKEEQVKKTIHAMIGEQKPRVLGLLNWGNWGLKCVLPENNDVFGTYSFAQINSIFSITTKKISEISTHLKIVVSSREGSPLSGDIPFLQSECEKFNKALAFYLENANEVEKWNSESKPSQLEAAKNSGCAIFIPIIFVGSLLSWLLK